MAVSETTEITELDAAEAEAFADQVFGWYTGTMVTAMVDLGHRTGLFEALAAGPGTSEELAARSGLHERHVREWLGAVTTAGITTYDPDGGIYEIPVAHALCLAGDGPMNLAPISQMPTHLVPFVGRVADTFRSGGGVPYSEYRPEFTSVMDALNRPLFDGLLVEGIVAQVDGLTEALAAGVAVADIGCGTGHSTNLLAAAFPASNFVGYDLAEDALDAATSEAAARGLDNVRFEVRDVLHLPVAPAVDAVFAFDAIHDQADPSGVLARVFESLVPGGVFVMFDIRASSRLERNVGNPFAPMLYATSTLHCMQVSLATGGAGLGTVWGEELALDMLGEAGFVHLEVHEIPGDPMDSLYVARKPGR